MLTRDQIRAAQDAKIERVPLPEWTPAGESFDPAKHFVLVKSWTARERDEYESWRAKEKDKDKDFRAVVAVRSVCDERGFLTLSEDDIAWLTEKSAAALDRIVAKQWELSRLGSEQIETAKKNSSDEAGTGSSSTSPAT